MADEIIIPEQTLIVVSVGGKEYTLDCSEFTARECGILKRIGHIRGIVDVPAAVTAGDMEVAVALAIIAANRVSVTLNPEALLDGKIGSITLNVPEAADPPAPASETGLTQNSKPEDCGTPA